MLQSLIPTICKVHSWKLKRTQKLSFEIRNFSVTFQLKKGVWSVETIERWRLRSIRAHLNKMLRKKEEYFVFSLNQILSVRNVRFETILRLWVEWCQLMLMGSIQWINVLLKITRRSRYQFRWLLTQHMLQVFRTPLLPIIVWWQEKHLRLKWKLVSHFVSYLKQCELA